MSIIELNDVELAQVSAGVSDDAIYGASFASAIGFFGMAFIPGVSIVGAGIFLGASIFSSTTAAWIGAGGGSKATIPK